MAASLKAETVIERELERFVARKHRAEAEIKEAEDQIRRLEVALAAVKDELPLAA